MDIPLLLIRESGQTELELEGGGIVIWLLHFLEPYDHFDFFYSKLGESREKHSMHHLSGFIIVLHCILLNLFVLNHNMYPFSAIKTKQNLYLFLAINIIARRS